MKDHVVQAGECITSIADRYGFFWDTLWNDAKNSALKELRKNPNTLVPGDIVHVPDLRPKQEACAVGQKHKFKLKGIPALFRMQLFRAEAPRANEAFEVELDGRYISGTTDGDGVLEIPIPATAKLAKVTIGADLAEYQLNFGQLPPVSELEGVQARLRNLGFNCFVGRLDQKTKDAITEFQQRYGLTVSGELDDATRGKLESVHDEAGALEEPAAQS